MKVIVKVSLPPAATVVGIELTVKSPKLPPVTVIPLIFNTTPPVFWIVNILTIVFALHSKMLPKFVSLVRLVVTVPLTILFPFPCTFISGKLSLSVIVIVREVGVPKVIPAEGEEIVSVAVSVPSTSTSSTTVNVTEPVVCPFKIVIVVLLRL